MVPCRITSPAVNSYHRQKRTSEAISCLTLRSMMLNWPRARRREQLQAVRAGPWKLYLPLENRFAREKCE